MSRRVSRSRRQDYDSVRPVGTDIDVGDIDTLLEEDVQDIEEFREKDGRLFVGLYREEGEWRYDLNAFKLRTSPGDSGSQETRTVASGRLPEDHELLDNVPRY